MNQLVSYGARVIGYDVVFSSSDTTAGIKNRREIKSRLNKSGRAEEDGVMAYLDDAIKEADHDQISARALKKSRRTILGYFFHFSKNDIAHLSESEMERYLGNIRNSKYNAIKKSPGMSLKNVVLPRAWAVESNIAKFSEAARGSGFFVRSLPGEHISLEKRWVHCHPIDKFRSKGIDIVRARRAVIS